MFHIRMARNNEIDVIVRHRIEMLRSMGWSEERISKTKDATRRFLNEPWDPSIEIYFLLEHDEVIGGCAVSFCIGLPTDKNPSGRFAYLFNMFVEPEHRRKGLATALIRHITQLCRERGIEKMTLHDTKMSKNIYEREGFVRSENYYIKFIED